MKSPEPFASSICFPSFLSVSSPNHHSRYDRTKLKDKTMSGRGRAGRQWQDSAGQGGAGDAVRDGGGREVVERDRRWVAVDLCPSRPDAAAVIGSRHRRDQTAPAEEVGGARRRGAPPTRREGRRGWAGHGAAYSFKDNP